MTRSQLLLALLTGSVVTLSTAQDKVLLFDNASPAKSVRLLNGSSVSITTSGNLTAKCVLEGSGCADIGTGTSNPNAPTVSIGSSNFSNAAGTDGKYPANTQFTITPNVSNNAEVCVRLLGQGTPVDSLWTGSFTSNFNNSGTFKVPTANSTYNFLLKCYNSGGANNSNTLAVVTGTGVVDPNPNPVGCDHITPPPGFVRATNPDNWVELQGTTYGSIPALEINNVSVEKLASASLVFLGTSRNEYVSIPFTTPSDAAWASSFSRFVFDPSQIPGTFAQDTTTAFMLTITRCPADFRYNVANQVDSTDANVCRSMRPDPNTGQPKLPSARSISYNHTGVSGNNCGLAPNTQYYLNYINANATDGIQAGEHNCPSNQDRCGFQFSQ